MKERLKNKLLKNKKSVIYSWSVSYIYTILIFIAIILVIYIASSAMYKKQIEKSNNHIMEHMQSLMDGVFEGVKRTSSTIWLDSDVVSLLKIGDEISDSQYAEIKDAITKVKRAQASNENVESVSIIDYVHGRVYTSGGVIDMPTYYNLFFEQPGRTYYDLINLLSSSEPELYITTALNNTYYNGAGTISYIRPFGYLGKGNLKQSLVVTVRAESFLQQMKSIKNIGPGGEIYIINADGSLMVSTGGEIADNIDSSMLSGDSGSFEVKCSSGKYVVKYSKSGQGNWFYIMANPKSQYRMNIALMQLFFSIGTILALIFAFICMHRFINKNYGSLFVILNMLGRKDDTDTTRNEFDMIADGIRDMVESSRHLDKQIYDQNRILRNTFLERLFRGHIDDMDVLSDDLYMYDIKFTGNKFLALVIFLEDETENTDSEAYSFMQMIFIISNVMEELIAEHHYGILFECDGVISGIINVNDMYKDTIRSDMEEVVSKAREFISEQFGFNFTAAFSSVYENIENSDTGYNEAIHTMKYKKTVGIDETMFYDDIRNMNKNGYYYPFDIEHKLSNFIRTGEIEEAKKLAGAVIEENMNERQLTPEQIHYLVFNIASTIIRTINEITTENDEEILIDTDIVNEISRTDSLKEKINSLYTLIDKIQGVSVKTKGVKNNWIVTGVIPYIEKNYKDCNLSVSMIASEFKMHPVYTSRIFKEQTGTGLFEYISKFRINKAKEILINTDYTLERVAEEVGYTTSRTFARMFKKTEGITPGKYREMHHK